MNIKKIQIKAHAAHRVAMGLFCVLLMFSQSLIAQISAGGTPLSYSSEFQEKYQLPSLSTTLLPPFPLSQIQEEDSRSQRAQRFAAPIPVNLGIYNSGEWTELSNQDRLWRLHIQSKNALAIALQYDQFYLPPGATLYMYSPDQRQVLGAYTAQNNQASGKMLTGLIKGSNCILEYYEPANVRGMGQLHIFQVQHAYEAQVLEDSGYEFQIKGGNEEAFGYCTSLDCEINVNCPEGHDLQNEKRGVCRIMMVAEEGMNFCSGSLINNTNNDGTPYVLSAFHCMDGYTPQYDFWRFDFNYESNGCTNNPDQEPDFQSIVGCHLKAGNSDSDFTLYEINKRIPSHFNVYFNGWNRSGSVPFYSSLLHHPSGDVKKISIDDDPAQIYGESISWSNDVVTPPKFHFRTVFDAGTFEVGSSGGSLFDHNGQIIGQLHGGNASCTRFIAFFGRFHYSWDSGNNPETRLSDWLDPRNMGVINLRGINAPEEGTLAITGFVQTENNNRVKDVNVTLSGIFSRTTTTDEWGRYFFTGLNPNQDYRIQFNKEGDIKNGVTTFDLIKIRRHILGIDYLNSPYKNIAGDINNSKNISTLDIIQMRQLILAIREDFPNNTSWRFMPVDFIYTNPSEQPFEYVFPESILIENLTEEIKLDFLGIKIGDVNLSANPEN